MQYVAINKVQNFFMINLFLSLYYLLGSRLLVFCLILIFADNSGLAKKHPYTSQKNTFQKIIYQKNISRNVYFPELTFAEITLARMNTCLKLHLPERTLA